MVDSSFQALINDHYKFMMSRFESYLNIIVGIRIWVVWRKNVLLYENNKMYMNLHLNTRDQNMHFNHLPMGQKTQILKKLHRRRNRTDDNQHFCRIRLERIVVCRWPQLMLTIMTQINLIVREKSVIPDSRGKPVAQ